MLHKIYYILDENKQPVECDAATMQAFLEKEENQRVALDEIPGGVIVSTVFLGINHNWSSVRSIPILFETMLFDTGDEWEGETQWRYCTYEEAVAGHKETVERLIKENQIPVFPK